MTRKIKPCLFKNAILQVTAVFAVCCHLMGFLEIRQAGN